jgi:hypothetical protein
MCLPLRRIFPFLLVPAAALLTSCGVTSNPQGPSTSESGVPPPSGGDQPSIALSTTAVTFSAAQGRGNPASQTISITNGGKGSLSGLSTRITYGGPPTGWLEASLARTTAPTTLTLTATTAGLGSDAYRATVTILSAAATNGPQSVTVDFVVGSPTLSKPDLQAAAVSGSQVTLRWTFKWPAAVGGSDEYQLEKSTGSTGGFALVGSYDCSTSACRQTPFVVTLTESPGTYYYRVRARTSLGSSGYSQVQSAVVAVASITRFTNSSVYSLVSIRVDGKEYVTTSGNAVAPGGSMDVSVAPGNHQYRVANGTFQGDSSFVELYVKEGSYAQPNGGTYSITFADPSLAQILSNFQEAWIWTSEVARDCSARSYQYRFTFRSDGTYDLAEYSTTAWTVIRRGTYSEKGERQPSFTISVATSADGDGSLEELGAVLTMSNGRDSCSGAMKYHKQ